MAKKRIVGNPMTTPYNPNAYSITVDDKLSSDSTNPVQNKVVNGVLQQLINNKAGLGHTHTMSDLEDYVVDAYLDKVDLQSTNPVQNKVIAEEIHKLQGGIESNRESIGHRLNNVTQEGNTVYFHSDTPRACEISVATPSYVDDAIGEIETSLENIITKYGLGGESV